MKSIISITLFLTLLKISLASVPTQGQFIFSPYGDADCTTPYGNDVPGALDTALSCWPVLETISMRPSDWDAETEILKVNLWTTSGSCSGDIAMPDAPVNCDGRCIQDAANPEKYFTCLYKNIPSVNFQIREFSDNKCDNPTVNVASSYSSNDLCWSSSETNSFVPLSWQAYKNTMSVFYFASNDDCFGDDQVGTKSEIKCDGSCVLNTVGSYYQCSQSGSTHLVVGLILTFALLVLMI